MVVKKSRPTPEDQPLDAYAYDHMDNGIDTAEHDFLPDQGDPKLAALVGAMFDTKIGKLRKAVLTPKQAVAVSRAFAFAAMYAVPELAALCEMLMDTTVSIKGKGLHQMVTVMSARMQADDDDSIKRLGRSLGI